MQKTVSKDVAFTLAQRACAEYLSSLSSLTSHPLLPELSSLRAEHFQTLIIFFQDLAELTALAVENDPLGGRSHLASQSARKTLARHPSWMRCASDLASQSRLSDAAFERLAHWIE
jgi:hypothetical protein